MGGWGADTLIGGEGDDLLLPFIGKNSLFGGDGNDIYNIHLTYDAFWDMAGYDSGPDLDPHETIVGGLDLITEASGDADKVWIVNFPSHGYYDPFDQYFANHFIDQDGNFNFTYELGHDSPSMLKYSLKAGYEDATFGEPKLTSAKMSYSGPDPTNANNYAVTLELTFDAPLAITNYEMAFLSKQKVPGEAIHNLSLEGESSGTTHKFKLLTGQDPSSWTTIDQATAFNGGIGNYITAEVSGVFQSPTTMTIDLDQIIPFDLMKLNGSSVEVETGQTGQSSLYELFKQGKNLNFDLGKIETWPGFDELSDVDKAYYTKNFSLDALAGNKNDLNIHPAAVHFTTVDGVLLFQNLQSGIEATVSVTKADSASATYYTDGSPPSFQWTGSFNEPAQVKWVDVGGGNIAVVWALDIWKEQPGGGWNSDYDLFYAIINGTTGEVVAQEQQITDSLNHEYVDELSVDENNVILLKYSSNGEQKLSQIDALNNSVDASGVPPSSLLPFIEVIKNHLISNDNLPNYSPDEVNQTESPHPAAVHFTTIDGVLLFQNLQSGIEATVSVTKADSASATYYTDGSPPSFQWTGSFNEPAQVKWVDVGGGNIAVVWALDIWKEQPGGGWNSDYDLFYAIINGTTGEVVAQEQQITDSLNHEYVDELSVDENNVILLKYSSNGEQKLSQIDASNLIPSIKPISQGFTIKDFAVQDEHGNWNNTIESIVFSNQEGKHNTWWQKNYLNDVFAGKKSGADIFALAQKDGFYGTEFYLSPQV